jgi:hypothetical protein
MNKIKSVTLVAFVLGSVTTYAAKDSTFQFQNSVRVGYDDNIYQVKNNPQETAFITDIINITGTMTFSDRSEMELYWQPEFRYRFDADPKAVTYQDLYARFSHGFTERMFLELSDRLRYQEKDGQSDLAATVNQNFLENDLLGALSYTLNSVSQVKVGAGYEFRTWDDDAYGEGTGAYAGRANNYDQLKADGSYVRQVQKDTTFAVGGVNFVSHEFEGTRGGYDAVTLYGGVDHNFNPNMLGSAQLGYSFSTVDSVDNTTPGASVSEDTSSPFLQLAMDYTPSERTTYTGSLGYSLTQSENSYYNATDALDMKLGVSHDLTGKISISSALSYVFSMYDSAYSALGLPDSDEQFLRWSLRGSYQINRNNFVDVGYEFSKRDSVEGAIGMQEYSRNRLDFGWRLRF